MRNVEWEYISLRLMTFFRYFGDCLFYGYFYLFLKNRGLFESQIGAICALTPIITLLCNPLWNYLSKDANKNRLIMRIITVLEGIFIMLYTQVNAIEIIALITCMVAFVGSPFYNLHDGFCGTYAEAYGKNYTKIRFIGTFAYFCGTITASIVLHLTDNNYALLLILSGILFISVSFWFYSIKPINLSLLKAGEEVKRNYQAVLNNKTFWFYMLIYFLLITIPYSADSYVSLYFTEFLAINPSVWSLIFGGVILAEFVILLLLGKYGEKINITLLFFISGLFYMLRSIVLACNLPLPLLVIAALFRGVGYGLFVHCNIRLLKKICGLENVTTALFILSIGIAVVQIISSFAFGNLVQYLGYQNFFMILGFIGLMGNIIHLIYLIKKKFNYTNHY